jgi:hypothetical protein
MTTTKRGFSPSGIKEKLDDYHGGCGVYDLSPDIAAKGVKSVNTNITFEDAMRLSTAIQSAILKLNRYNRSTKVGNQMGLCLSLKSGDKSITVIEVPLRKPKPKASNGQQ